MFVISLRIVQIKSITYTSTNNYTSTINSTTICVHWPVGGGLMSDRGGGVVSASSVIACCRRCYPLTNFLVVVVVCGAVQAAATKAEVADLWGKLHRPADCCALRLAPDAGSVYRLVL